MHNGTLCHCAHVMQSSGDSWCVYKHGSQPVWEVIVKTLPCMTLNSNTAASYTAMQQQLPTAKQANQPQKLQRACQ